MPPYSHRHPAETFVLTQAHIDLLNNRMTLDMKFEEFMEASIADRKDIRAQVSQLDAALTNNARTVNEMHLALFAKDDSNIYGVTGLMCNMQKVVKHIDVVCNIAKFVKWGMISLLGMLGGITAVAAALAALRSLGMLQ